MTMTEVPIVQPLDAGHQEGHCNNRKVGNTEPFDVIESGLVGIFKDRVHDHAEVEI